MDFATVEVPPEEGLWAKVVKAYLDFNAETEDDKGESDENKEAKD